MLENDYLLNICISCANNADSIFVAHFIAAFCLCVCVGVYVLRGMYDSLQVGSYAPWHGVQLELKHQH